jgi:hypothetical protein
MGKKDKVKILISLIVIAVPLSPGQVKVLAAPSIDSKGALPGDPLSMLYSWSGSEEALFMQIPQPLVTDCGIVLQTQSAEPGQLDQIINSATPPDVVIWSTSNLAEYKSRLHDLGALGADQSSYTGFFFNK